MSMTRRGRLSSADHLLDGVRANDLGSLGFIGEEIVHLGDGAVEGDDGEAVVVHVENQVLAHDGQTNQCDVSFWFHLSYSVKLKRHDTGECGPRQNIFGAKTAFGGAMSPLPQLCAPNCRRASLSSMVFRFAQFASFMSLNALR